MDNDPVLAAFSVDDDIGAEPVEGDQLRRETAASEADAADLDGEVDNGDEEMKGRLKAEAESEIAPELRPMVEGRIARFRDTYPFTLEEDTLRLSHDLSDAQRLYLFLLVASCYRNLKRGADKATTTKGFERLGVPLLKRYFGDRLEVHVFGTAAVDGERYHGDMRAAVELLSADTKLPLGKAWEENAGQLSSSGDRGLDVVGWIPCHADDPADLCFVIFGQCATGRNWPDKQFEASAARWGRLLHLTGPVSSLLLIAFSYRRADGSWYDPTKFAVTNVVFDRDRIVALIDPAAAEFPDELVTTMLDLEGADDL